MNRAKIIREYKAANPNATPQAIANATNEKIQYVYQVLHKQKIKKQAALNWAKVFKREGSKVKVTAEERQLAKGQQILRDEISNLHRQITRLKLHNDMLQSMLKVQEFDLMHGHGAPV